MGVARRACPDNPVPDRGVLSDLIETSSIVIDTADFKKGTWVELDGKPWMVVDVKKHAPTARGGKTLVQTKLRNLLDGTFASRAFKAGEMFEQPDLKRRDAQFLYRAGDAFTFMDNESYEQFEVSGEQAGDIGDYLIEGAPAQVVFYNDQLAAVELPQYVELEVTSVEPGTRGDTTGKVTTPATLVTGLVVQVPLFVKAGDKVRVDTRTGEFHDRVL